MGYETDLKLFIDGVWKTGEGRDAHTVLNPVNASPIAEVPYATKADLDEALEASNRAWPEWRSMDVEKRGAILHKAAQLLRERVDLIAATMTQEQGKILAESKAETLASAQLFDWYAEDAKRDYGRTLVRPAGQVSRVIRQPVGPVATFTPWNFPLYLLAKKVRRGTRRWLHRHLAPAARNSGLLEPSFSARLPMPASRRASPSSSTASPASSARRSSPARSSARSASPAPPMSASI